MSEIASCDSLQAIKCVFTQAASQKLLIAMRTIEHEGCEVRGQLHRLR